MSKTLSIIAVLSLSFARAQGPGPLYTIGTIAGTDPYPFAGDGRPETAAFTNAESLARDRQGNLYIGERANGRIRKIDASASLPRWRVPAFSADGTPGTIQLGSSLASRLTAQARCTLPIQITTAS